MGPWQRGWATVVMAIAMVMSCGPPATQAEEKPITFGEEHLHARMQMDAAPEPHTDQHHRSRRQLFDGWTPLRDALTSLENVDEMLRTTVPAVDRLQCLERFMCEMSSGSIMNGINEFINPTTPIPHLPLPQPVAQFPTFPGQNPAFQQGFQQFQQPQAQGHPSQFQQRPAHPSQFQQPQVHPSQFQQPQAHPSQFQQFQQHPQQAFPPQGHPQNVPQQGFQQHPQQGFQQQGHPQSVPQQGFQQHPQQAFPQHQIDPNQVQQTFDPTFQQGGFVSNPGFQQFPSTHHSQQVPAQHFSQFRETSGDDNTIRREGEANPITRPRPLRRKKTQKSGLLGLIQNMFGNRKRRSVEPIENKSTLKNVAESKEEDPGVLSRNKRDLLDSLLGTFNAFSPDMMLRLVDQYMVGQQNSLYPYSHAAIMGYTGSPQRCARMYPECPTNPDDMIHVFNNIRRYYPDGMPFADQLPWPLKDLFK